ncbi:Uma2 family endonuclease [Streptomyces mirabilis]|uniref:Uma2 family endonuclease n=1 Tax=Streptomyces mirabilis TaxID=68239 RepID=UPI0036CBE997
MDAAARAAGAPVEVLEATNVTLPSGLVVPDLVVADAGTTAEDTVSVDADAVQLVVELVSPGNKTMDREFKPLLYAEAAIPHFWRLEFEPAPRLIVSELQAGRYVETTTALAGATTRINAPFPVDIDPAGSLAQPR